MKPTRTPTRKLFKEFNPESTLSIEEWRVGFVEQEDLTEYKGAMALVGSWKEWLRFKKEWPAFGPILQEWKDEIEVKLKSRAIKSILEKVEVSVDAAKWFAESKYAKRKAGTPSKEEVARQAKVEAKATTAVEDEIQRVMESRSSVPLPTGQPN